MQYLKYTLVLILLIGLSAGTGHAQERFLQDSFLLVQRPMPFDFLVLETRGTNGEDHWAGIRFRSVNNPDQFIRGQGRMYYNPADFPGGEGWIRDSMFLRTMMTEPRSPANMANWPGGQPPFPMILDAVIREVDGEPLLPRRRVTVRVNRVFFEDLTE